MLATPMRSPPLFAAILVVAAAVACARLERASECFSLAGQVNPALERIEQMAASPQDPKRLRKVASAYRDLAAKVKATKLTSTDIASAAEGYHGVLLETAGALDALAETPPPKAAARAEHETKNKPREGKKSKARQNTATRTAMAANLAQLETIRRREEIQVGRLDRLCERP
jgi:hypothetical protein